MHKADDDMVYTSSVAVFCGVVNELFDETCCDAGEYLIVNGREW